MNPDVAKHSPSILIVDNEQRSRDLLQIMLAAEGFQIQSAASAEQGLAMIQQQPPDLILLDVMMAGMDGYQMASKIKGNRATRHIPIVMVTARDDQDGKMLGLLSGAENFLTKPVNRAELCLRARNLIRLKAYGDECRERSEALERELAARSAALAERIKVVEQQAGVVAEQAALLDLARQAVVVRDVHDHMLYWSHGAELMYGWLSSQVLGRTKAEVLKSEFFEPVEQINATLQRLGRWEGESIQFRRDGTRLTTASCWTLQRDLDGAPSRILSIDDDISVVVAIDRVSVAGERPWT
ncbi:MAG TPA: response regulator [Steroidobacteraceae bacterium]|nr:response regulator [Steroidobacteraceae bacterium]